LILNDLEPTELIEKLAVLIPWPRSNVLRYHGVFCTGFEVARSGDSGPFAAADSPRA
jgi:hypothetical protein